MNETNTPNHAVVQRAERWLRECCPMPNDAKCNVCRIAAREMGRRSGLSPLLAPLAMAVLLLASQSIWDYWRPVVLIFLALLGASVARVLLSRRLVSAEKGQSLDLARKFQVATELVGLTWGGLIAALFLVHGIDRITELALVATLGLIAGTFTTLTLERTLWQRFNLALWLPIISVSAVMATRGVEAGWLLLLIEVIFAGFATLQGQRIVHNYINGLVTHAQLEDAVDKIADQRTELTAHRARLDELIARTHHLSYYDQLTGIGSRNHFLERLRSSIVAHREQGQRFAVLYLDLDGFKDINDTFGHAAGDQLLKVVAQRAAASLRSGDFAARIGSDELALLVHGVTSDEDIAHIAHCCRDAIQVPVKLGAKSICPRVSIGIAVFPDDERNAAGLLKAAESAMNAAKQGIKSHLARYLPEMSRAAKQRLTIEQELRQALRFGQFELYYQPQFSTSEGVCCGVEALIRWNHPTQGIVSPLEFIPIAENVGLIDELGEWVLDTACRQAVSWFKAGIAPMTIAVNISPLQLLDPDLVTTVSNTLSLTGLDPSLLEIEITESAIQTHVDARSTLARLHDLGVRLALDDFGTGYSSLASLRELPIDRVKIDRSFVADILSNAQDGALLGTIIEMAHVLGTSVVAEGVEQRAQAELLADLRCDCLQGYFFSRPVPAAELELIARARAIETEPPGRLKPALVTGNS